MLSLTPELLVEDLPKTLSWYETTLGFKTIFVSKEKGVPTFARIKLGGAEIMFFTRPDFAKEIPAFSSTPMGGSLVLYIEVTDIEVVWSRIKNQATIIQPLHQTTYGSQEFTVKDPNGYHLMFGERN